MPDPQIDIYDHGAVGDGVTDDYGAVQDALYAAGDVCGTVVGRGHFMLSESLKVPLGVTIQGSGRSAQYEYAGNYGTKFDWAIAPSGTDGMISVDGNALQMVRISDVHLQRAPGNGINFAMVHSVIENVTVKHCGASGVLFNPGAPFMFGIRNMWVYANGADGVSISPVGPSVSTTTLLENIYANGNVGTGVVMQGCTTTSLISCAADSNGAAGIYIANSKDIVLQTCDAEANSKSGYYWASSFGSMINSRTAINNQSNTPGHASYLLAEGSEIDIIGGHEDDVPGRLAMNALSGSIIRDHGVKLIGSSTHDVTSSIYGYKQNVPWNPDIRTSGGGVPIHTVHHAHYSENGREVTCMLDFTIHNNNGGAGHMLFSLPSPSSSAVMFGTMGAAGVVSVYDGSTAAFTKYDETYPGVSGKRYYGGFTYQRF